MIRFPQTDTVWISQKIMALALHLKIVWLFIVVRRQWICMLVKVPWQTNDEQVPSTNNLNKFLELFTK